MRGRKLVFVAGGFVGESLSKLRSREGTDKQTKKNVVTQAIQMVLFVQFKPTLQSLVQ